MPEISLCKQMIFPAFFYFAIENMRIYFNTISPFVKQVIAKWMINYWQNVALRKIDITKSTAPPFNDLILNIINRNQYLVKSKIKFFKLFIHQANDISQFITFLHAHCPGSHSLQCCFDLCFS